MLIINDILNKRGLKVKDLAEKLGMLQNNVSAIINEKRGISIPTLKRIADILEVDILDLFEDNRPNHAVKDLTCPHCNNHINIDISKR